ncbi:hypothetical protein ACFL1X_08955 [Candidatus Hydrogenedentota bacterium]
MKDFTFYREAEILKGLRSAALEEDTKSALNEFSLRPLDESEYAVFSLDLCNDRVDRHFSRFPVEELEKINKLLPGKPLMERHDVRGSLPVGTFFRSTLHEDGEVLSVRPDVYIMRTPENEALIMNIEGGVYRGTSIGFTFRLPECSVCGKDIRECLHVPGKLNEGELCHYIMRDVIDVLEGSIVFAGSQGTEFVGSSRNLPTAWGALVGTRQDLASSGESGPLRGAVVLMADE